MDEDEGEYRLGAAAVFLLTWAVCWFFYGALGLFLGWMPALFIAAIWPLVLLLVGGLLGLAMVAAVVAFLIAVIW